MASGTTLSSRIGLRLPIPMKAWIRAAKYDSLYALARRRVGRGGHGSPLPRRLVFVIGCGRSGTSLLGDMLARHPQVVYVFEPYHLWTAIDPRTDASDFYRGSVGRCLLGEADSTPDLRARFWRAFAPVYRGHADKILVEKTPINALRIGYLNALAPEALFLHIGRDGIRVSRSIEANVRTNEYRIARRPDFNQWWGVSNAKWKAMARDGELAGYFPQEVRLLATDAARGAYEWLVSMKELDAWRDRLGPRLHELTYERLTKAPESTIALVAGFLDLPADREWLADCASAVRPTPSRTMKDLHLPPMMCAEFNAMQARFGFPNLAIPSHSVPAPMEDRASVESLNLEPPG
jgi:hypothetical protein